MFNSYGDYKHIGLMVRGGGGLFAPEGLNSNSTADLLVLTGKESAASLHETIF